MARLLLALALIVAAAVPAGAGGTSAIAHIRGTIMKIDRGRHTFWIHHEPFSQMPMAMTMEVEPVRAGELNRLHVGERIAATIDTSIYPWPATAIRPAM